VAILPPPDALVSSRDQVFVILTHFEAEQDRDKEADSAASAAAAAVNTASTAPSSGAPVDLTREVWEQDAIFSLNKTDDNDGIDQKQPSLKHRSRSDTFLCEMDATLSAFTS
jgi:hypothetical protein